jgi:hypothetical protein
MRPITKPKFSLLFCIIFFAAIIFAWAPYTIAAPQISGINGTLSNNQIVTISGSSFGSHTDFNSSKDYLVAAWDNLENGKLDTSVFSITNNGPALVTGTENKTNSKYSAMGYRWPSTKTFTNVLGQVVSNDMMYGFRHNSSSVRKEVYQSAWFMFPPNFIQNIGYQNELDQIKFMMMSPMDSDNNKTYFNISAPNCKLRANWEDGTTAWNSPTSFEMYAPEGEWHRYEIFADLNAMKVRFYVDGMLLIEHPYKSGGTDSSAFGRFGFLSYMYSGDAKNTWPTYADDFFVNFTQARVELSASSKWDQTKQVHKEIQIPLSWTSSSIKFKVNPGSFTKGQTAYLYVIDGSGNVNASGYAVKVGETAASSPPSGSPPPGPGSAWIESN